MKRIKKTVRVGRNTYRDFELLVPEKAEELTSAMSKDPWDQLASECYINKRLNQIRRLASLGKAQDEAEKYVQTRPVGGAKLPKLSRRISEKERKGDLTPEQEQAIAAILNG